MWPLAGGLSVWNRRSALSVYGSQTIHLLWYSFVLLLFLFSERVWPSLLSECWFHCVLLNKWHVACFQLLCHFVLPQKQPLSTATMPCYWYVTLIWLQNFLPSANNVNFNHCRSLIILLLSGDGHKVFWSCHVAIIINVVSKYLRVASSSMMEKNNMIPEL